MSSESEKTSLEICAQLGLGTDVVRMQMHELTKAVLVRVDGKNGKSKHFADSES